MGESRDVLTLGAWMGQKEASQGEGPTGLCKPTKTR